MSKQGKINKITTSVVQKMKTDGEKISMLTAYDYSTAAMMDEAGVDIILIGDSLGMAILGYDSTLPVTMEDMLHHTKPVSRAAKRAMVLGDMPFMSYQISAGEALRNAGRFMKEAGAHGVKLEGGREVAETVMKITSSGIPLMGHLGLTPQSVHQLGGYKVQGKDDKTAGRMMEDARILEEAGAFSIVLECVPAPLAGEISRSLTIPTIGIGAGVECDGQVLVVNDMLGMFEKFTPKFVKKYAKLNIDMRAAIGQYIDEVKDRKFPGEEHSF
ncbi:MAG: 3-methyl-2-oxobutanoate hydroxymethyltransferase [Deltaproteobacteria bacterium]|nr:3-methyl-2-oxobutanoate hydroxymethyltransferase [Deltaproteobacteria bacterium]MBW2596641.1 3-methyl-2-oxobutanoate hydroxymethyltransferase [Deltaproteobacteria bacterium]MBW2650988.1 3-methyl-2-oxobutanoate hydroxymethyltransferase [Deltaproteobacteria bacterium]